MTDRQTPHSPEPVARLGDLESALSAASGKFSFGDTERDRIILGALTACVAVFDAHAATRALALDELRAWTAVRAALRLAKGDTDNG